MERQRNNTQNRRGPRRNCRIPRDSEIYNDLVLYWCQTTKKIEEITALLTEDHGIEITPNQVKNSASAHGLRREFVSNEKYNTTAQQETNGERQRMHEWHQYAGYTATGERIARVIQDNPVALIRPHHPAPPGGVRLGMATAAAQQSK